MKSAVVRCAITAALAVSVVACGSDDSGGGATTTAANSAASSTASSAAGTASTTAASGTPASGEPLVIGVMNASTGTNSFPGYDHGVDAAVEYVNKELGGINGRPLQLKHCQTDGTPESGQSCGHQFANDSKMPFALSGVVFNGGPFFDALGAAGKPVYGAVPIMEADFVTPVGRFFYGGSPVSNGGVAALLRDVPNVKKILFVHDEAGGLSGMNVAKTALAGSGIQIDDVTIQRNAGDVLAQVTAMTDPSYDAIAMSGATEMCLNVFNAFVTIKPKVPFFTNATCVNPDTMKATKEAGVSLDGIVIATQAAPSFLAPGVDTQVDAYKANYARYSKSDPNERFALEGWGQIVTLQRMLSSVSGDITPQAVATALDTFKGPVELGLTKVGCPGPAKYPALCAAGSAHIYKVKGDQLETLGEVAVSFGS